MSDYATLCCLDGDDGNRGVEQKTVASGEKVTCPHCTAIWLIANQYREANFDQRVLLAARRKLAA